METINGPLKLEPVYKQAVWGGDMLRRLYKKKTPEEGAAESWELSCRPDGKSLVANGPWAGHTLSEFLEANEPLAGKKAEPFPLLVKLLDAGGDLSVQVHPGDEYARKNEGQSGKTEMWYVVACEGNPHLVMGFNRDVTREEVRRRAADGTLAQVLNTVPVHPGDSFLIEAGTVHAIGKGLLIAEVQQNSGVTYRLYDYNRKDKNGKLRPLHLEKALDVIKTAASCPKAIREPEEDRGDFRVRPLARCPFFYVDLISTKTHAEITVGPDAFQAAVCTSGRFTVTTGSGSVDISACETVFLPAGCGKCVFTGEGAFLLTSPGKAGL